MRPRSCAAAGMRPRSCAAAGLIAALTACSGGRERAFLGNLHAHTRLSDGVADPAQAFARARAIRLSFLALTDHGEELEAAEWRQLRAAAAAADQPGRFAALAGWEWSSPTEGHFLVLGTKAAGSSCRSLKRLDQLAAWTREREGLLIYAHPGSFDEFGAVMASALGGPEVAGQEVGSLYSGPAGSGYAYHDHEDAYRESLRRGLKVGAQINQDNHHQEIGDARRGGLTGIWMRRLGTAELLQALRSRRSFGTEAAGIALDLEINGTRMGGTLTRPAELEVRGWLTGLHAGLIFQRAELWAVRAGHPVWTWQRHREGSALVARLPPPRQPEAYYLRVEMIAMYGVKARAFSSPVWVEHGADPILRGIAVDPAWPALARPALARIRIENAGPRPSPGGTIRLSMEGGFRWQQPLPTLGPRRGLTVALPLVARHEQETVEAELILEGRGGPQRRSQIVVDACPPRRGAVTVELLRADGASIRSDEVELPEGCVAAAEALSRLHPIDLCGGLLRRIGPLHADQDHYLEVQVDGAPAPVGLARLPLRAGQRLTIRPRLWSAGAISG